MSLTTAASPLPPNATSASSVSRTTTTTTLPPKQPQQHVTPDNNNNNNNTSQDHSHQHLQQRQQQQQQQHYYSSLTKRMTVDKNIVDELLLVCGVLGTTDETKSGPRDKEQPPAAASSSSLLIPVEDCLLWLQDLQRALRRDDDLYRPVSLLLGQWHVVPQKLLPLVWTCRYDTTLVLTIIKILVILTKPLAENTIRAGRMVIDTKKKGRNETVIQEQIKLRDNALQQAEMLLAYKRAICHHPSHRASKHASSSSSSGGILSVFVSLLAEPLSKQGTHRTDADHLTMELVLHLFRNLLAAEPLLYTSPDTLQRHLQLHHEFIVLLEQELVLDIFLVLGADLEQRENAPYNLLLMELLQHLIKQQDPTAVARSAALSQNNHNNSTRPSQQKRVHQGLLKNQLQRERQSLAVKTTSRHSHFSGTLVVKDQHHQQKQHYVSTNRLAAHDNNSTATAARRKNKKTEPFIGAVGSLLCHRARGLGSASAGSSSSSNPAAQQTLHRFCQRFVADCYGPVMKSLKNEFRRDSVRLEDGDRVIFAKIVWFFGQWWRAGGRQSMVVVVNNNSNNNQSSGDSNDNNNKVDGSSATTGDDKGENATNNENKANDESPSSNADGVLGQLIFTLDLFTFKLVVNAIDTFQTHKRYTQLAQVVALLSEMMHQLFVMYQSKESTEQLMAMGLMDRLFYGSDPLDHLPKLLSRWAPGTSTREYLCDVVEICHMTLKLLDAHAVACHGNDQTTTKTAKVGKNKKTKQQLDTISKMKAAAADFDVTGYFVRKIVSNATVFMYTQLLSQYAVNSPLVNHRIVAFFTRLCQVKVAVAESVDDDMPQNLLATKTVTLEPMLYNVQLLMVLNKILNDVAIRKDKDYATTLSFAYDIVHGFALAASENPMLFVEALLKHPVPHRFCELATNHYVNEELRMLAERNLLLEEQRRFEQRIAEEEKREKNESDDDSDEEELEFDGFGLVAESKTQSGTEKAISNGITDEAGSLRDEDGNSNEGMKDLDDNDVDENSRTGESEDGTDMRTTNKRSLDNNNEEMVDMSGDAKRHRTSGDREDDGESKADSILAREPEQDVGDYVRSKVAADASIETNVHSGEKNATKSRISKRRIDDFSDDEEVSFEEQGESKYSASERAGGVLVDSDDDD